MYELFYKLDEEKQRRVINASLHIFSMNDFKHASTDDIASEAKIAKGSLFQYFKNKRSLYVFLYEYALRILSDKAKERFNFNERDYFEILRQSQRLKMDLLEQYPYLYKFVIKVSFEKDEEIQRLVADINKNIELQMYMLVYQNIDFSKFKEDIEFEKINNMITWCSESIWNQGMSQHLSIEEMYKQVLYVYDFYRKAVYKEEYLK